MLGAQDGDGRRPVRGRRAGRRRRRSGLAALAVTLALPVVAAATTASAAALAVGAARPGATTPGAAGAPRPTATTPATGPVEPGGVNLGAGIEETFASLPVAEQSSLMEQVRASGATWIRIAMAMPSDEYTKGNFTWYSDTEVRAALAAGLHVDGEIGYPASWARYPNGSPNLADWATFAEAAAAHYSPMGVTTFEMWNEPNTDSQWETGINVPEYAQLLRTIYPVIKRADPQDNVMVGGLAPEANDGDLSLSPLTFMYYLYKDGAGGYFDSVGMHPYSFPNLPDQSASWNPWTYLPQLHALMAANGDGDKKIWLTEYGAPVSGNRLDVSPATQATGFTQAFAIARGWSWVGPLFAYDWVDWDGDGDGLFGLHDSAGAARPALAAFEGAIQSRSVLADTAG